MNLIRKGHGHAHRGVIGIESAIVLIAFVIVAAALAFVVLNMGFATTQKAKTAIISSISEAGSSLEISGKVVGFANVTNTLVNATSVPMKITNGGDSVDLNDNRTSVKYLSNFVEYSDILDDCTLTSNTFANASLAFDRAVVKASCQLDSNPITDAVPGSTTAIIFWTVRANNNSILDPGEHASLAIAFSNADRPTSLDRIRAEIILPQGATMTVERDIPNISTMIIDLG